jgi:hypothetical protein
MRPGLFPSPIETRNEVNQLLRAKVPAHKGVTEQCISAAMPDGGIEVSITGGKAKAKTVRRT